MYSALWCYPWDFLDEGVDDVLARVADAGLNGVSVAAAYHTVRALCPHNPRRAVYHGEGGVLYFRPEPRHFADMRIQPVLSDFTSDIDPLSELCRAARTRGVFVHAWTVLHHNTRLGTAYPECSIENAFGDRYPFGLCPANPDVRAYSRGIVSALASRGDLDVIELESLGYMGIDHSGHHAKAGVELDPLHKYLLSICFCPHCSARMLEHGGDVESARASVVQEMRRCFDGRQRETDGDPVAAFQTVVGHGNSQAILAARDDVVLSLMGEMREIVRPPQRLSVMVSPSHLSTGAQAGIPLDSARQRSDVLLHQAFSKEPQSIRSGIAAVVAGGGNATVYAGLQAIAPYVEAADKMAAAVRAARDAGAQGLQFYHYGLMPLRNLEWIASALRVLA